MTLGNLLARLVPALDKSGMPYMVTGSVASSAYGLPRSTADLDVVIAPDENQLVLFIRQFPGTSYYADEQQALSALARRSQFNLIDFATGWKVDFIIAQDSAYSRSALSRRMRLQIEGTTVYVAAPEDVLIAKLQWAKLSDSKRQIQDAVGILATQRDRLDLPYIEHWVNELLLNDQWHAIRRAEA